MPDDHNGRPTTFAARLRAGDHKGRPYEPELSWRKYSATASES